MVLRKFKGAGSSKELVLNIVVELQPKALSLSKPFLNLLGLVAQGKNNLFNPEQFAEFKVPLQNRLALYWNKGLCHLIS